MAEMTKFNPLKLKKRDLEEIENNLREQHPEVFKDRRFPTKRTGTDNRFAIINTANRPWAVIDSSTLFHLFPSKTREFYFSPKNYAMRKRNEALDIRVKEATNFGDLLNSLAAFNPSLIYLRVSPHTASEPLISFIRICFPKIQLWIEFYDLSCLFSEKALLNMSSGNQAQCDSALEGCSVAFHHCQGIVLKAGGSLFQKWVQAIDVPIVTYFPSLDYRIPPTRSFSSSASKLLYAGALSSQELLQGTGSSDGANMIRYFDEIAKHPELSLQLINAVHDTRDQDHTPKFSSLMSRYQSLENVTYRRAIPRIDLIHYAAGMDAGLCCSHYSDDTVMEVTRISVPNRMMTYLCSGLPVIIDDRFEFAANLISSYAAGAVIPAGDFPGFIHEIKALDTHLVRDGVQKITLWMKEENKIATKRLLANL
jgi:hypothetical protein